MRNIPVKLPLPGVRGWSASVDLSPISCRAYYAQKFLEYGDTVFFVLRKSFRQLTPLHIYHHVSITIVVRLPCPRSPLCLGRW